MQYYSTASFHNPRPLTLCSPKCCVAKPAHKHTHAHTDVSATNRCATLRTQPVQTARTHTVLPLLMVLEHAAPN